jgi:hypothetical protein
MKLFEEMSMNVTSICALSCEGLVESTNQKTDANESRIKSGRCRRKGLKCREKSKF